MFKTMPQSLYPQEERDLVPIVQMGIRVGMDRSGKYCAHWG